MIQKPQPYSDSAPEEFKHCLTLSAPLAGKSLSLNNALDPSVSIGLWGMGIAIQTSATRLLSPVEGIIESIDAVSLRWVVKAKSGLRLMIQLGPIPKHYHTERLSLAKRKNDKLKEGDVIATFDPLFLKQASQPCICAFTVLNTKGIKAIVPEASGRWVDSETSALHIFL